LCYVEGCAAELAAFECADERGFVEQRTTPDIDQPRAGFHARELSLPNQVFRLGCFGSGDEHIIRFGQDGVQVLGRDYLFCEGGIARSRARHAPHA